MVLPWASTALPEKLTSRGTVTDEPDAAVCWAFETEENITIPTQAVSRSRLSFIENLPIDQLVDNQVNLRVHGIGIEVFGCYPHLIIGERYACAILIPTDADNENGWVGETRAGWRDRVDAVVHLKPEIKNVAAHARDIEEESARRRCGGRSGEGGIVAGFKSAAVERAEMKHGFDHAAGCAWLGNVANAVKA